MITTAFGTKDHLTQAWDTAGKRVPVTIVTLYPLTVTHVKTLNKDGYQAIQVGFEGAKREIRVQGEESLAVGEKISPSEILKAGDVVNASGVIKGRGFAGVVKRHGFKGGPRTHGQSDRERAPGSIGQGTSPGRVRKGKRMPGHYGATRTTVRNLTVLKVDEGKLWLKGQVPGAKRTLITLKKIGEQKGFVALLGTAQPQPAPEQPTETTPSEPTPQPSPTPAEEKTV